MIIIIIKNIVKTQTDKKRIDKYAINIKYIYICDSTLIYIYLI